MLLFLFEFLRYLLSREYRIEYCPLLFNCFRPLESVDAWSNIFITEVSHLSDMTFLFYYPLIDCFMVVVRLLRRSSCSFSMLEQLCHLIGQQFCLCYLSACLKCKYWKVLEREHTQFLLVCFMLVSVRRQVCCSVICFSLNPYCLIGLMYLSSYYFLGLF